MRVFVWQWGRLGVGPRYAYELSEALAELGHETVLSLAQGAEVMQSADVRAAVTHPVKTYASSGEFLRRTAIINRILNPLLRALQTDRPDVAIVPMTGYWDIFLMRRLRRMGIPVVSLIHDAQMHPGDNLRVMVWLQRVLIRLSAGVVTMSDFVARQLQERTLLAGKVHATIPLASLNYDDLELPPPQPPVPENRALRLLMGGRLKRYKGLDLFADALRAVGGNAPLIVRVVGAPDNEQDLEALRSIPFVEFDLGWKSDRDLVEHLDWADAAILPYTEASQSGVVPVSFGRGRAVIVTPIGGLPEQVQHGVTGLVSEAVSAEALADAICLLAHNRDLVCQLGEQAMRYAQRDISWTRLAPRFAEFLRAVAGDERSADRPNIAGR